MKIVLGSKRDIDIAPQGYQRLTMKIDSLIKYEFSDIVISSESRV